MSEIEIEPIEPEGIPLDILYPKNMSYFNPSNWVWLASDISTSVYEWKDSSTPEDTTPTHWRSWIPDDEVASDPKTKTKVKAKTKALYRDQRRERRVRGKKWFR